MITNKQKFHSLDDSATGDLSTYILFAVVTVDKITCPLQKQNCSVYQINSSEHIIISFQLNVTEMADFQSYLDNVYFRSPVKYAKVIQIT